MPRGRQECKAMAPGHSVPDQTEGVTRVEDLPEPLVLPRPRTSRRRACPRCGRTYRDNTGRRVLHDPGSLLDDQPRERHVPVPGTPAPTAGCPSAPSCPTSAGAVTAGPALAGRTPPTRPG